MNIAVNIKLSRPMIMLIICIAVISAGVGGYYFFWMKTPEYSLKLIQESVKNHDLEKFKQHVDIDSLISHAVDDILTDSTNTINDNQGNNLFLAGLMQLFKPILISTTKDEINYYVENGSFKKNLR